jgi:hypothetical protein
MAAYSPALEALDWDVVVVHAVAHDPRSADWLLNDDVVAGLPLAPRSWSKSGYLWTCRR